MRTMRQLYRINMNYVVGTYIKYAPTSQISGIIMCELIGRVDADPDVLPRTENFGLDYIAFSAMCPKCPPDFLKLTYNCVKVCIVS